MLFRSDFGLETALGNYTVVAYNPTTTCTDNMSGLATVSNNPLPTAYNVTGGGNYCIGGTGVHVGLDFSGLGVNYQLYLGGVAVGAPLPGSNSALDFGLKTATGIYTVVAINTSTLCTSNMTGSAVVTNSPLPTVYTVAAGGSSYCAGGTGIDISLSGSDLGIAYQLFNSGTPVGVPQSGTGLPLDFGLQTVPGTYTIVATDGLSTCTSNMFGSAPIVINALPVVYTVTGGGSYCAGGAGFHVGLSNSEAGVNYQLFNGGLTVGSPVAGTGSSLDFGAQTMAGTYTVAATNGTTTV